MEKGRQRGEWVISEDAQAPVRMRAPSELEFRETGLVELSQSFEELGVPYFVADGTLLGAVRDGDFIPWDGDVGIWIKQEIYAARKLEMVQILTSRGFIVDEVGGRNPKLNVYKYAEKYELESWRLLGRFRARGGFRIPAHLLNDPGQIELRGRHYPCPTPVEEFLYHRYGEDWRIPKVLSNGSSNSRTRWAQVKRRLRRMSPGWLIHFLRRG